MPRRQPFTALCRQAAALARPPLADLHTHTTASDGDYTPSQVVAFAAAAGLKAVAITDHDTTAGHTEAADAVRDNGHALELVRGVEITTHDGDRDYHLLAYDAEPAGRFQTLLSQLQEARRRRFEQFVRLLRESGVALADERIASVAARTASLGRRHLAQLLVELGVVGTLHAAFHGHLCPLAGRTSPLRVATVREVIDIVHAAGGLTSLAHPSPKLEVTEFGRLRDHGLDAVEVQFPAASYSRSLQLAGWAADLGLGVTGGSDCHGRDRRVGCRTIPLHELTRLRRGGRLADP